MGIGQISLESILVYWHLMAYIPEGIMKIFKTKCFNFLWRVNLDKLGNHLTNQKSIAKLKQRGGWGIQDLFQFGKALAAKSLWNLFTKDSLWKRIILHTYIAPDSLHVWVIKEMKHVHNVSNHQRMLTLAFPLIGLPQFGRWVVVHR